MKKHPSLRMPGRWFGARRDAVFDPLKPGVPPIVEGPISYLEKNGVNTEGLFRTAGSAATSRVIKARFDKGKPVDLSNLDVHTVAGVVTLFFNKLPNPLLTTELYDCFITAVEVPDEETRLECIRQCLELLPPGNKAVLARLVGFLKVVAENKAITKMDSRNLAIVFAPTILRPPDAPEENSIAALLGDSLLAHKLMEAFIKNYDDLLGTNKPVCRLKIRHSLTPVQQAAFFRTIKRGTIKLAEAMLTYDGIGSPMPPPPPPPPPPLMPLAPPSSADTKNKKEKRTRSRKEKANKKERKSSISRSGGGGRGGAATATPPTPTSPFPGVPLHTASRPLDALPEVDCGNPRRLLSSKDEEYWFGPYSGSDSEDEPYELDANAAIVPHPSEGDGAYNNNAERRQTKKARRKGAMLSASAGLVHAGESAAQHPPSELLTASMPQSARSSARHIGGDADDDSGDDDNDSAELDRVVSNPLLSLPGWSEGELQRKLTRKMRSGSEGVSRDVRRDTRQRGNTTTGGSVMLSPSPSTPGSGERRVSITTSASAATGAAGSSAATGREKKRASHSPSAPVAGSLIALASVPPPLVSFDEPGGGSVVVLGSGGTGAGSAVLLRSSVGSTPRGRSTSGSLATPSTDSIPKNRNNSNSSTTSTSTSSTTNNSSSSSSKKRISLNRINGINAMEKVSDMIRNVKERKNKNKRDSSLNGSGGSTAGNTTEVLKVGEAHLQAHLADTAAQPESPKDSGAAPWPVRKKTAAKLEDAVEVRRRLQQQKGLGDSLGDTSSGDDSSFDPDVDGGTSAAGPSPVVRKRSDPVKLAVQERKRSNSDLANMPSSSSSPSSPSSSSASSSSSLALVTASGLSLSANLNINPSTRRWSRGSRTTTAQARGGGETDSCSSDQSDPSSDSASSLESGGAGADYLTAHRVMTRGHSERSTSVGSGGADEKFRRQRKMKSGVPEGSGSAAAEASTAAASGSGSASGESPVLVSTGVGLRLTVTGASGELTPVREVVQGEGQGELASDVSLEHEVVTSRTARLEVEIDDVDDDHGDSDGEADDSSDDEPPEERAATGNEWYSETLPTAAGQRRSSAAQQKPQQDHQDTRGGRPRPAGLHPLDPRGSGGSTSASSSPAMHRRALAHMLVSPRLNRSAPTASGDDPAARSSNLLSRARSSADTRSPKLMRRHHSKTELPTAGAHLQFAPEHSPDVSTSTSPSEARLHFPPPPTDFATLATRRLSAPTRYGAGLWDDEAYDPYDDYYPHYHHHGVMAWQRTAQGWRRGLTPSPPPAAVTTDRQQRRRRRALMRDPSGSHTGSEICVKTSRSSPAVELLPRSFSSPALIPHGPRPKPPDAHEIAESILKGNLTDLWSKYLSTLQPNRRASTDLKIVSILKERMQSLDSDDSDDMLEYFMDTEGVDAAAAELMSARTSAGLPQRRPSLSGTTSSSTSPAVSSRRRTLARSNEERTQATTTAAAKEEKNKENKEKEKENNDNEEKGTEKEEGNIDKGQQQQQRETRERIQG